jgi:hypothetical protein
MMPASEMARGRARDVARWLRVLQARGTHAPAISLVPDATRALLSEETEPRQLMDACRRAKAAVDRQIVAERIGATDPSAESKAAAVTERGGLQSAERQAICALLGELLAEIVAAIGQPSGPA